MFWPIQGSAVIFQGQNVVKYNFTNFTLHPKSFCAETSTLIIKVIYDEIQYVNVHFYLFTTYVAL